MLSTELIYRRTSSKATLRLSASSLLRLLPTPLHEPILASRYHARNSGDIVIQSDTSRNQADNALACYRKLLDLVREAGQESVPGETSVEQLQRVEQLQKAEAAYRRRIKEFQSKKKASRRGGGRGEY